MNTEVGDKADLRGRLRDTAVEAGAIALRYFVPGERTSARVWTKGKSSPVTEADIAVEQQYAPSGTCDEMAERNGEPGFADAAFAGCDGDDVIFWSFVHGYM